jgi:dihydroxyacetone kinase-like predicted kinase
VQTVEITQAVRSAQLNGLDIAEGQFIGLINDELVAAGEACEEVARAVFDRVGLDQYEIVTVYYGQGVMPEQADAVVNIITGLSDQVEVEVIDGGQAHYHYVISVE